VFGQSLNSFSVCGCPQLWASVLIKGTKAQREDVTAQWSVRQSHPHRPHSHELPARRISGQAPRFLSLQNISTFNRPVADYSPSNVYSHLVGQKFNFLSWIPKFITVFIKDRHWSLSWDSWIFISVRLQALTAASMKMTVFWDVAPCTLIEIDRHFGDAYWFHHQGEDGGSKHIWNVGKLLQQPRR
jgi:hypothetical protein